MELLDNMRYGPMGKPRQRVHSIRASCSFSPATTGSIGFAALYSPTANPRNYLQAFPYAANNGSTNFGINSDTYLFFTKGQQPTIEVFANSAPVQGLNCTVSGYYY